MEIIKKNKVLLAEDDNFLRKAYQISLKNEPFELIVANDGIEAYLQACKQLPELILLDILMPHQDGIETLKKLKNNPKTKTIPILILSNSYDPEISKKAIDYGANEVLVKSTLNIKDLREKIFQYIQKDSIL